MSPTNAYLPKAADQEVTQMMKELVVDLQKDRPAHEAKKESSNTQKQKVTHYGARTRDIAVKSRALYRLS